MSTEKTYSPKDVELKWLDKWKTNNNYSSNPNDKNPYTIVIPPPNVTGILHMGHMLNNTIQDILIRKARLDGLNACWVPGTDHASIATEAKVVNMLKEKNINKHEISRSEFIEYAWDWTNKHGGIIIDQLKRIGCSCDWNRTKFTLDDDLSESVIDMFIKLFNDGYVYRDKKIVNWDPEARTTLSNEEVVYIEKESKLYFLKYKIENSEEYISVATTRPETIFGDTAVAVNPKDKRYKKLKGKNLVVPIVNRVIPLVFDELVEKDFGTGCLKVTPAHSEKDFEIGLKHKLDIIDIFNDDATLNKNGLHYDGLDRFVVRKKILTELEEKNQLIETKKYKNKISISERTSCIVEPKLSTQWFLKMKSLSKPALDAVMNNDIKFYPKKYVNTYKHWMENVRDWNISRQLYWGHRIPVFYSDENKSKFVVAKSKNEAVAKFNEIGVNIDNTQIFQENDVLDTWFSSWLWPISVFDGVRNPKNHDISYYYPTSTIVTGPDIIFFWIARMVVSGLYLRNKKPFENVYFTGIVRDNKGKKMSKQLGNSPDPIELIEKYGADSVRIGLLFSAPAGNDLLFDESLCVQGRNFTNKIWNAFRLFESFKVSKKLKQNDRSHEAIKWFESKFNLKLNEIDLCFKNFKISESLMIIYKLVWDDFCSVFLEIVKPKYGEELSEESSIIIKSYFNKILVLINPFMPFLSEELFEKINNKEIISENLKWPKSKNIDSIFLQNFDDLIQVVTKVRNFKKQNSLGFKDELSVFHQNKNINESLSSVFEKLTNCKLLYKDVETNASSSIVIGKFKYIIDFNKENSDDYIIELKKDFEYNLGFKKILEKKLSNENFVNNAPEKVIQNERDKLDDVLKKIEIIKETLDKIS
ncbi:MAG: valine--tRNA ligase [Flavobacteriaceae bacterium]|nr:valine--tRNA ligase [Flavobacteriaceae bacterium]